MLTAREILLGMLLPAVIAALWLMPVFSKALRPYSWLLLPLALATAYMAGYLGLWERPPFPPIDTTNWIFYLPIFAVAVGLLISPMRFPRMLANLLVALLYFTSILALLKPTLQTISFAESAELVVMLTLAGFLSFVSINTLATRDCSSSIHLVMFVIVAGTAQVILMSGTVYIGKTALALAAALGGGLPFVWWFAISWRRATTLLVLLLWHAFLISAYYFSMLTPLGAMLLAIAPHLAWLAEGPRVQSWPKIPRILFRLTIPLIPMLIAQTLALLDFLEAQRASSQF